MNKTKIEKRLQPFHDEENIGSLWNMYSILRREKYILIYLGFNIETREIKSVSSWLLKTQITKEEVKKYNFFCISTKKHVSYTHHQMLNTMRYYKVI